MATAIVSGAGTFSVGALVALWKTHAHWADETPTLVRWNGLWGVGATGADLVERTARAAGAEPFRLAYRPDGGKDLVDLAHVQDHEAEGILGAVPGVDVIVAE